MGNVPGEEGVGGMASLFHTADELPQLNFRVEWRVMCHWQSETKSQEVLTSFRLQDQDEARSFVVLLLAFTPDSCDLRLFPGVLKTSTDSRCSQETSRDPGYQIISLIVNFIREY